MAELHEKYRENNGSQTSGVKRDRVSAKKNNTRDKQPNARVDSQAVKNNQNKGTPPKTITPSNSDPVITTNIFYALNDLTADLLLKNQHLSARVIDVDTGFYENIFLSEMCVLFQSRLNQRLRSWTSENKLVQETELVDHGQDCYASLQVAAVVVAGAFLVKISSSQLLDDCAGCALDGAEGPQWRSMGKMSNHRV